MIMTVGNFTVKVVFQGEKYGRDNCLTHEEAKPLVEFYDSRHKHTEHGQSISRYYASTLLEGDHNHGLCLYGGEPAWNLTAPQFLLVCNFLEVNGVR